MLLVTRGRAFPAPPSLSGGSQWCETVIFSPATAFHWAPAQHVIAGCPEALLPSFSLEQTPGERSQLSSGSVSGTTKHSVRFLLVLRAKSLPVGPAVYSGLLLPCGLLSLHHCWTDVSTFPQRTNGPFTHVFCLTNHTLYFRNICVH